MLTNKPVPQWRVRTAIASDGGATVGENTGMAGFGHADPSFSVAPGYESGLTWNTQTQTPRFTPGVKCGRKRITYQAENAKREREQRF
ncbi:hypothetical protein GN244_ATG09189 [Phytophthora infestans]|uniref:Uncharacterized protein n=1 Tax=Phytophthora infestans TaxID=4787 RepID=A0A833STX5_PHYIN|nr:hypothetical protein GN244_ATG09189 [Phytophthora infestans]